MRSTKYNIILMRDDTSVRRFRLRPFWLKFFVIAFIFLFCSSIAGGYVAYVLYEENAAISRSNEKKEEMLSDARRELQRLQNVEKMLKSYNELDQSSLLAGSRQKDEPESMVDLSEMFGLVDMGVVSISNLQARFTGGGMGLQFEINNLQTEGTVSGRIYLSIIRQDGLEVDLGLEDDDLDFAISRFKNVDVSFNLPETVNEDSAFALRVVAKDSNGNEIYAETFPLSHIVI
ncbi:MAG: hypothetical protein ABR542_07185 [Desulfonatronovibrio sp.]